MREVKFRAWDLENKIMWCHEELAAADPDGVMSFNSIIGGNSHCLVPMQYTGLRDKNGKEIYEGDIVKVFMPSREHNFTVEFEDAAFLLKKISTGRMWLVNLEYPMEVIGNIYENSDLLTSATAE